MIYPLLLKNLLYTLDILNARDYMGLMEFKLFIIGITILYLVLGFTVLGWLA